MNALQVITANDFIDITNYELKHKDSELYSVIGDQKIILNKDLALTQSITFAYINWLKEEMTKQINTPLTPDRFSLLMATKRNLFNIAEISKQLMKLCN